MFLFFYEEMRGYFVLYWGAPTCTGTRIQFFRDLKEWGGFPVSRGTRNLPSFWLPPIAYRRGAQVGKGTENYVRCPPSTLRRRLRRERGLSLGIEIVSSFFFFVHRSRVAIHFYHNNYGFFRVSSFTLVNVPLGKVHRLGSLPYQQGVGVGISSDLKEFRVGCILQVILHRAGHGHVLRR